MKRRRWWVLPVVLILLAGTAYGLQDAIYNTIVIPFAYLLWLVLYAYSFIPQVVIWIALLVILLFAGIFYFLPTWNPAGRLEKDRKLPQGPVESLALWLIKSHSGTYFRWQVANRLGKIAQRTGHLPSAGKRLNTGLEPVMKYLDAGLTTSFADYPRPKTFFNQPASTPLDLEPNAAVDYLESQMELKDVRNP